MNFQPHINPVYPPNNNLIFEEWFSQNIPENTERKFLPVHFTSYWVNHNYGGDLQAHIALQDFINAQDISVKWYAVLQYDDGPMIDLSRLDIKVFGSGGGHLDVPIPLICQPHPNVPCGTRSVFASFAGAQNHPIRKRLFNFRTRPGYEMPRRPIKIQQYCELMAKSVFALCPRGYGASSFRICEALQFGAIPVYISDEFIIPQGLDFSKYGVIIKSDDLPHLNDILRAFRPAEIAAMQRNGQYIYQNYYTYEGCRKLIIENL